eukprot:gene3647-3897_t
MASTPSPSIMPTLAPTEADLTPSTLVVGMGVGTFTIIFLSVALAFVWCVSDGCGLNAKGFARCASTIVYAAVFLALVFAPRESKYQSTLPLTEVYDESMNTRISVCAVIFFFGIISVAILLKQSQSLVELSTTYHDATTFWQDE